MIKCLILFLVTFSTMANLQKKLDEKSAAGKAKITPKKEKVFAEFMRATKELKDSGIEKKALNVGAKVPSFKVDGIDISTLYKKSPLIITFYRGHWCPYCMMELKAYELQLKRIKQYGRIIALVPDTKKMIAKTRRNHKISFPIFSDKDNKIAAKFGLKFRLDKKVERMYKDFKIDLKDSQGNDNSELPIPATYVVNKKGIITYAFIDADYKKRAEPNKVISALAKVK